MNETILDRLNREIAESRARRERGEVEQPAESCSERFWSLIRALFFWA